MSATCCRLQGVDHILQAADIAFIEEDELKELESRFIPHALSIAEVLVRARKSTSPCVPVLYVKDLAELELENLEDTFWEDRGAVFLVRPEARETILAKYPRIEEYARLVDFDPVHEDLAEVLEQVARQFQPDLSGPVSLSVLAPFFFLVDQRVALERFSRCQPARRLTLFSNNYTLQGVKIKGSKSVLNRVPPPLKPRTGTIGSLSLLGQTGRHLRCGFVIHSGKVFPGCDASGEDTE